MKRIHENLRLFLDRLADRTLDRRLQRPRQFAAILAADLDRLRQNTGLVRAFFLVLDAVAQLAKLFLLAAG